MNTLKVIFFVCIFSVFSFGCATKSRTFTPPPSVAVVKLDDSLNSISSSNKKISSYIDKSLSYADQIDLLLQQAEKQRDTK